MLAKHEAVANSRHGMLLQSDIVHTCTSRLCTDLHVLLGVGQVLSASLTLLSAEVHKDCSVSTTAPHQPASDCTLICEVPLQAPNGRAAKTIRWLTWMYPGKAVLLSVLHNL